MKILNLEIVFIIPTKSANGNELKLFLVDRLKFNLRLEESILNNFYFKFANDTKENNNMGKFKE